MSRDLSALPKDQLWKILVDTVHALPMFKNHRRYVEDVMNKERPDISSRELAIQLNIPLGEAIVILDEIRGQKPGQNISGAEGSSSKSSERTLLDFGG